MFNAAQHGNIDLLVEILANNKSEPERDNNELFVHCCMIGKIEAVKILIADKRVDPSDNNNWAIEESYESKFDKITELLIQDERVSSSLKIQNKKLYDKIKLKTTAKFF